MALAKKDSPELTKEELKDYVKKDSIQNLKESKTYLDSLDIESNKFKLSDLITGYTHNTSFESKNIRISSPLNGISRNTVQGYNSNLKIKYTKRYDGFKNYLSLSGAINYSFETQRTRGNVSVTYKFNDTDDLTVGLTTGISVNQFNSQEPISELVNSISTLYFEENYMKLYESRFVKTYYSQELFNGFSFNSSISYEDRRALYNLNKYSADQNEGSDFTSNNPLDPLNYNSAPFENHTIVKFKINGDIRFGQKYLSYPGRKINIPNLKYPKFGFSFEKGISVDKSNYNFDHLSLNLNQRIILENKGNLRYFAAAGTFFNNPKLAFIDFKHFNGNQTHVNLNSDYLRSFKNLAYYDFSSSKNYIEYHLEHNFNGFILGKIPLIRWLQSSLETSFHLNVTDQLAPYYETSLGLKNLGFGKYRFFRIDYVRAYQNGFKEDGVVFGFSF